ncbi:MAG: EAL domain-containing protein [Lachnospiraceae bacterium]|nr:EAL domain-containing protein [Lachnospiraceae bacterium]
MLQFRPEYCIAASAAMLILLIMFFMKRNYGMRSNRIFFLMLIDCFLAAMINISTFYVISFPERYPLWFCYACNEVYLFLYNAMAVLLLLYIDSKTRIASIKKLMRGICMAIALFDALIIFTTHWTKLVVFYDENLVYTHGPMMRSLYVTAFMSVAIATAIFNAKHKMFNLYQVLSIDLFVVGVFASVIFQLGHREYVISNFVCAMVLFFIYTAFENQAYYLHGDTLCYNRRAFIKTVDLLRFKKEEYMLAIIRVADFENIRHSLGKMGVDDLSERIAERVCRKFGKSAYYIDLDCFAVSRSVSVGAGVSKKEIESCFEEQYLLQLGDDEVPIRIEPDLCFVRVNDTDISGSEMVELIQKLPEHYSEYSSAVLYADELIKPIRREKEVLRLIDKAIRNRGFVVYYQPILDVEVGSFTCAEALIRLKDEEAGLVGPEEFIPVAEKNGRIHEIGDYVFRDVCRFIRENEILSRGVNYIEINLSPEQCNRVELANQLITVAMEYGIDFRQINLEITETAEMRGQGVRNMNRLINNLHDRGVTFSLDDFGSGFAAIDYLIKLPVDIVKIDKGILWQAMNDEPSMKILKNTIRMIKEVGKKIVVEGIETREMADLLIRNGCDYLQGYLYSRPVPEEEYLEFLSRSEEYLEAL